MIHWMKKQKKNYGRLSNEGSDKVLVRRVEARNWFKKSRSTGSKKCALWRTLLEGQSWGVSQRVTAEGRLAEISLLDQVPRNIFQRDCPSTFSSLAWSWPRRLRASLGSTSCTRVFYLPLCIQVIVIHERSPALVWSTGLEKPWNTKMHADILRHWTLSAS